MSNYRRNYVPGGSYFFTVALLDRQSLLLIEQIDLLRASVQKIKQQRPFTIDAWVVLPDHLHAVWTLPEGDSDYSGRWREIKKTFVKSLPNTEPRSRVRKRKGERGIWQRRFWEHTLRNEFDYAMHINYVHINPLKHGLVKNVVDWPYSSFHRAVTAGIYPPDWAGDTNPMET
jgi:putative transposase